MKKMIGVLTHVINHFYYWIVELFSELIKLFFKLEVMLFLFCLFVCFLSFLLV